jgi:hypothetical protein
MVGSKRKVRPEGRNWRPLDDEAMIAILEKSESDPLEDKPRRQLWEGINQDIEACKLLRTMWHGQLPYKQLKRLRAVKTAIQRLSSELRKVEANDWLWCEMACAIEWADEHNFKGQDWAGSEAYVRDRSMPYVPNRTALVSLSLDRDRIAKLLFASELVEASVRQIQKTLGTADHQPKKPDRIRHFFVRHLGVRYERAFKLEPKITAGGPWLRFLAEVISQLEEKTLSSSAARDLRDTARTSRFGFGSPKRPTRPNGGIAGFFFGRVGSTARPFGRVGMPMPQGIGRVGLVGRIQSPDHRGGFDKRMDNYG